MPKDFQTKPYIDHFLQAEILSRLAAADRPLRFSELKERGIDNSLFMYHTNKLISRALVEKGGEGFALTVKGARWANQAGVFHAFDIFTPRPLVQFVIRDANNNVLLALRKGQLRQRLNDYLLPGNIFRHGLSLEANAKLIMQELFGDATLPEPLLLTVADIIHTFDDGFVNHVISYIFSLDIGEVMPATKDHPLFTVEWVPINSITTNNPKFAKSQLLPQLFARLPAMKPHESFLFHENK